MLCPVHGTVRMMEPSQMERILQGMLFGIFSKSIPKFHLFTDTEMNKLRVFATSIL